MSRLAKFTSDSEKFNEHCHSIYGYISGDGVIEVFFDRKDEFGCMIDQGSKKLSRLEDNDEIIEMRKDFKVL
jgi:hypothetical protein